MDTTKQVLYSGGKLIGATALTLSPASMVPVVQWTVSACSGTGSTPTDEYDRIPFDLKVPLDERREMAQKLLRRVPNSVPIIIEKCPGSLLHDIRRRKYIVQGTLSVANFITSIRNELFSTKRSSMSSPIVILIRGTGSTLYYFGDTMAMVYRLIHSDFC